MRLFFCFFLFLAGCLPPAKQETDLPPATEDKSFVIVVPSYNSSAFVEGNLRSILSQKYTSYRVIYIDDHSIDDTYAKAAQFIRSHDEQKRVTLIRNDENVGLLANIYNAVHSCHDHEIVVLLDGSDRFAHDQVLRILNQVYADDLVWITYGNSLDYPSYRPTPSTRAHRSKQTVPTNPRSFYASLFKKIKLEDLFYRGRFFSMGWDGAILFPMLEMASSHAKPLTQILYLKNEEYALNELKLNPAYREECLNYIATQKSYRPLKRLPVSPRKGQEKADLLVFSKQPEDLETFLTSVQTHVSGLNRTIVLYRATSTANEMRYLDLKLAHPNVQFVHTDKQFKKHLLNYAFQKALPTSHALVLATDEFIVQRPIDLGAGISALQTTESFALYYTRHLGLRFSNSLERYQPIPPLVHLASHLYAWQLEAGNDDWSEMGSVQFTLYQKEPLKKILSKLSFDSVEELLYEWGGQTASKEIGLFPVEPALWYNAGSYE